MPEFIIRAEETDLFFLFKDYKELVRCKDCRFSVDEYGDGDCYCRTKREVLRYIGDWNHYCGWGEKK